MIIRCWGARGSIPVSGQLYITYGGDTTCIEIRDDADNIIIIDAGSGIRALGNRLVQENRHEMTILFTHGHWDHIMGLPFFKPLYDQKTQITVYGCPFSRHSLKDMLAPSMNPPNFPIRFDDLKADITFCGICSGTFTVGSIFIETIHLSHPNQGIGYKFTENGRRFVFLTDNELSYTHPGGHDVGAYQTFCEGADLLVHDAEYTDHEYKRTRTWGHSTYRQALALALDAAVRQFGLFHHNQDRSDDDIDKIVHDCRTIIREHGSMLSCFAMAQGMEIVV
ncbi:MAG: MBL fold metallo-hydrolase [Desulfobacterota bacterium]|nr:MBL fold metallo-hydrolase [Thermodesulfobacteriota bacterium]